MLSLITRAAVEAAIQNTSLDPNLRNLLAIRATQMEDDNEPDIELGDLAHFHAVEARDSMIEVKAALGFAIDIKALSGTHRTSELHLCCDTFEDCGFNRPDDHRV